MSGPEFTTAPALAGEMRDALDRAASADHAKRIADAMAPDPREWSYEGDCVDGGGAGGLNPPRCTCGHTIRWIYTIVRARDGKTLPIGSTCIESTVPYLIESGAEGLASALQAAVARTRELQAEAERRARDAANSDRVRVLSAERERLDAWLRAALKLERERRWNERRRTLPRAARAAFKVPAALSTPGRTAASIARTVGIACAALIADGEWPDAPLPEAKEVRAACRKELRARAGHARDYSGYQPDPVASLRYAETLEERASALEDPPED